MGRAGFEERVANFSGEHILKAVLQEQHVALSVCL